MRTYTVVTRKCISFRPYRFIFWAVLFMVIIVFCLPSKKLRPEYTRDDLCSNSYSNNSIPLPLSFSSYYAFSNCNNAFNTLYSSFQCLNGNPSDFHTEDLWHERVCLFHNVCLRKDGWSRNYVIDYFYPSEMESLKSTIIRHINSILVSLRHGARAYSYDDLSVARLRLVSIDHLSELDKNKNIVYLDDTYLIYQLLAHKDMNFGHFIFDDVFGLYSNLKQFRSTRFNIPSKNRVLVHQSCSSFTKPLQNLCEKFTKSIFPVVTSHPIRSIESLFDSSNQICFRQLMAGQGIAGAVSHLANNIHRARIFDEFRFDLLNLHDISPNFIPREHHIAIVEKNGRRKFKNLKEIYSKIQTTPRYAGIKVTILSNFVNLTIADQLKLFQTLTIVISPCGGISLLFSFLSPKSTLIVSGFPKPEKSDYSAGRMEAIYWDYQSHLNVLHYPVNTLEDFELADHLKKDDFASVRNYADIILKTEKLFPLIDRAIIRASLNY